MILEKYLFRTETADSFILKKVCVDTLLTFYENIV